MHYMTGFWTEMCDAMVKHDVLVLIIVPILTRAVLCIFVMILCDNHVFVRTVSHNFVAD